LLISNLLAKVLYCGFTWLVLIMLLAYHVLFFRMRITITGELTLISGQWCRARHLLVVPAIPIAMMSFPIMTPVFLPTWWAIWHPAAEVGRRSSVITHGHTQYKNRHIVWLDEQPRSVVPIAGVPVVVVVNPVLPIVEEVIGFKKRIVINGIAGYRNQIWEGGNVNADIDTELRIHRGDGCNGENQNGESDE
jgi:hypothetical protein